ncbi:hypothetical protein DTX80_17840 [Bacilli bacterium]|nr:hypothetical protein WH51_11520 [Bacilli bacterium VT-13-104]PZD83157.1 hypothetical protein DEJ64_15925 [Bacilli bacterium]PZD84300.1 hypothetical protein DEJ60_15100 [Bacilli bacterium]PZD86310.1 hypothetical protein DEJ66_15735 [Bacilli bacterium]RCO04312.1 hypothetical protein DTX80_17840 [Bacilli bacterium]
MNFKIIVPSILALIFLVTSILLFVDNQKTTASLQQSEKKYSELKSNSKLQVQNDAKEFLQAFYNYKDRPKKEQLNGVATKELQDTLLQTYDLVDDSEIDIEVDYKSEINNILIYHAQDEYDSEKQAYVLARFNSVITLNGKKNESTIFAEITLEKQNGKWIASEYTALKDVNEFQGN